MIKKKLNKIKIISGKYKNSLIKFSNNLKIKPTKSIIKKSLFELIKDKIKNSYCLDLFAGSGSLGIESLSRGAKIVYFVDLKNKAIKCIENNLKKICTKEKVKLINSCAIKFLKKNKKKFDIIFLDPPYNFYKKNYDIINSCKKKLKKNGIIYFENYKNNKIEIKNAKKIGKNGKIIYYII
ncbi:16S rRNA (guanine(966)-N(2))-methyltransferase RsmD [Candidatus Vidania fulgoroideorum]